MTTSKIVISAIAVSWLISHTVASAALSVYQGNGQSDRGGIIGQGSLALEDKGSWVSGTINKGSPGGTFSGILVLYVDVEPGGFADTTSFTANGNGLQTAISGNSSWGSRSDAMFTPGFLADYAIALGPDYGGALYHFAGDGSFDSYTPITLSPLNDQLSSQYKFSFSWSDLGLADSPHGLKFQSSYAINTGIHSLESYESIIGPAGFGQTLRFENYNTFGVVATPVPEMTNAGLAVFGALLAGSELVSRTRRWVRGRTARN